MRLTAVAELIGLRATGVTYYFPRKEDLAVACLESGYAIFHDLLAVVEREPDAGSRIARLIELFVERDAAVRRGQAMPLSAFAAIRAMEGEHQTASSMATKRCSAASVHCSTRPNSLRWTRPTAPSAR